MLNDRKPAKWAYAFGGLSILSSFPLPDLRPDLRSSPHSGSGSEPDIVLDYVDQPPAKPTGDQIYCWQGRYKLTLEDHASGWLLQGDAGIMVLVSRCGKKAWCHCPDPAILPLFLSILVRRILPRLCALHGRLILHAASLVGEAGAVVVFGGSGAGKSTLTAALARALNWSILADDMPVFSGLSSDKTSALPQAWPSLPGISLWRPSKEAWGPDDVHCTLIPGYRDKYWCVPPGPTRVEQAPIRAIIFIALPSEDRSVEWKKLSGADPMVIAASQMVLFNPADQNHLAQGMAQVKYLVEKIPSYALAYPRDFAALPQVAQTIRQISDTIPHANL